MESKLQRVISYLQQDGAQPDTTALAALCGLSPSYFHREFKQAFGVNLHALMRWVRLHRAAHQLAFRTDMTITDIGLDAGFSSSDSFARSFRFHIGVTPSAFRNEPDWQVFDDWEHILGRLSEVPQFAISEPAMISFSETQIALKHHHGNPNQLMNSVQAFIQWRRQHATPPGKSKTFNLFFSSPDVPDSEFSFGIACEYSGEVPANAAGITGSIIPNLTCLSWQVKGSDSQLQSSVEEVMKRYDCNWAFAQFPPFIQRQVFYPDVPAHEAQSTVYLPVNL